ncbi:response regulator transcription factor [Coprothermobacteraceae bacterium]|nr:response regulator transcription factor [Coprothermobacteraceae bacterium]
MPKIALVEDDDQFSELLSSMLLSEGYEVERFLNGAHFLDSRPKVDLVLLDIMMPDLDGFRVLEILRHRKDETPVIVISARTSEQDVVKALELGARDYVWKPIRFKELLARMSRLLSTPRLDEFAWALNEQERKLTTPDGIVTLTPHETVIMKELLSKPGRLVTRDALMEKLGDRAETYKTIDVHISNIKKKAPALRQKIKCLRGQGYVFEP